MAGTQYLSLPQEDKELNETHPNESFGNYRLHKLAYWSIVVLSVCSVIDVFALVYFVSRTAFQPHLAVEEMPIRSAYINLEDLYLKKHHNTSKIEPIVNLPKVLQVVDSTEPSRVFPQWAETWATPHGIVPINDRHLLATNTASTVAQFRVLDFGMEHCVIMLTVPSENDSTPIEYGMGGTEQTSLDVWLLKDKGKLDFQQLSWNTKPERDRLVGHFSTEPGTTQQLGGFMCASSTYVTIELVCQGSCFFESLATQKDAVGVYLQQHQTI
ncbi:hypothetical protein DFH07DRAFT_842765 [Mycena maculata]|uniref:Ubiquitin 3 binding protein But2 C-terminal domain-containing protein n=1 Tax=Mycena maculata TaxID=230809 RepID=A0AAD7I7F9_9AGAR|nr:hypothetical protein DFH07DRAFT_842765 [Mycena maculata]